LQSKLWELGAVDSNAGVWSQRVVSFGGMKISKSIMSPVDTLYVRNNLGNREDRALLS